MRDSVGRVPAVTVCLCSLKLQDKHYYDFSVIRCLISLMDDSDLDLSFLCSRLLKRVRRKCAESGDEKKRVVKDEGENQDSASEIQSRSKAPWKRKREKKEGPESKTTDRSRSEGRGNEGSETGVVREGEQKVTVRFLSLCTFVIVHVSMFV